MSTCDRQPSARRCRQRRARSPSCRTRRCTSLHDVATVAPGTQLSSRSTTTRCSASSTSPPMSTAAISAAPARHPGGDRRDHEGPADHDAYRHPRPERGDADRRSATSASASILAIILVYALLVVLFQSWIDPFIIMMAVPGALIGIIWMLALTAHDHQRRIADGHDHDGRHLGVELDPGRQLRQRHARARQARSPLEAVDRGGARRGCGRS